MISFTAIAAAMFTACPELCPSPCPGAPSIIGSCHATAGLLLACGMQSMSEPNAMTGLPEPHFATHAVGIPATPRSTVNPFCSRMPVRYFEVSNSCIPSSPKENTMSTISWTCFARASTLASASVFRRSMRGSVALEGAEACVGVCWE